MNTIGNHQDAIIPTLRHKTSLKKDGKRFEFYFVTEKGKNTIIGYENEEGNDVSEKVQQLQRNRWTY